MQSQQNYRNKNRKKVKYHRNVIRDAYQADNETDIITSKGVQSAFPGDWIVTDWKGFKYIIEPNLLSLQRLQN